MSTAAFLRSVLPDAGVKFLVELISVDNKVIPKHTAFEDIDAMASKALELSSKGKNVYFACAEYAEIKYKTLASGRQIQVRGGKDNAVGAKSLWLDVDVGKANDANSYNTRAEAQDAIKSLIKTYSLPAPTIVSSGNGFHCYWLFTEVINKTEWLALADSWRTLIQKAGFKSDPTRDKDIASILRIPGTINPKGNKTVKVLNEGKAYPLQFYKTLFKDILGVDFTNPLMVFGNSLSTAVEYPPSSLEVISTQCKTINWFSKTGAPSSEPLWRACLGVAKFCVDGEQLAHEWSSKFTGYSEEETRSKMDNWNGGPSLCDTFRSLSSECEECPYAVKTPVQLGYTIPKETEIAVVDEPDSTNIVISPTNEIRTQWLPYGVYVQNNALFKMSTDKKTGVTTPKQIAYPNFWPIARHKLEDNTYGLRIVMQVKNGEFREFDLPTKTIVDGRSLRLALAANEIMTDDEYHTMEYLKAYSDRLRQHLNEVNTYSQFGWTPDRKGFLMGDKLITRNGVKQVRLAKDLAERREQINMYEVKGTPEEWIEGVNTLYNTFPNSEPYQYAICSQFGGFLCALMDSAEWNGIPLSLTSTGSGFAKSTAIKIGLNAFLNHKCAEITGSSPKGVIGFASMMGTIPFLVDESTQSLPGGPELNNVLYALSNGRSRLGMKSGGTLRSELAPFKLMCNLTGNKNMYFQLTEAKMNPEATQLRVFEINMAEYPQLEPLKKGSKHKAFHRDIANKLTDSVSSVLTIPFLSYVMGNMDSVKELLNDTYVRVCKDIGDNEGDETKERFYARHVACSIVGLIIAKKLGFLRFNTANLYKWAINHIKKLRQHAAETRYTSVDKLASLLSDFHGYMIVTKEYDELNTRANKTEMPIVPIRDKIKARLVLGSAKERGRLILSASAVDAWCKEHGVDSLDFRNNLEAAGYIRAADKSKPMYLGKGVPTVPTTLQRCIELEYSLVQGIVGESNVVTSLNIPTDNTQDLTVANI